MDVIIVHFLFNASRDTEAFSMCERLRESAQGKGGPDIRTSRSMLSLLAMYSQRHGHCVEAERIYSQLMQWTSQSTGRPNGDKEGVYACGGLARLCHVTGGYNEANRHYQQAIEGGLSCDQVSNTDTLMALGLWEDMLEKQGKVEERQQIRQKYGHVWAALDEWRIPPAN